MTFLLLATTIPSSIRPVQPMSEDQAIHVLVDSSAREITRVKAVRRLVELHSERALLPMIGLLNRVEDLAELHATLLSALTKLGARAFLTSRLQAHDAAVRARAAEALGWLRDRRARALIRQAVKDRSAEVRCAALFALRAVYDPSDFELIAEALHDKEAIVRQCAAAVLEMSGDRRVVAQLQVARSVEKDPFVIAVLDRTIERARQST